ncbi:hypothetical protein E2C01_077541 [Portunus trituberculatus]|uniref:Uncharacterized protein n=1 Tax=Portunus trituberculatus TaxID=210409 RepID=A0A5B7IKI9_PORTR|nr:hypothetical protein [Portunus trituberculatus]
MTALAHSLKHENSPFLAEKRPLAIAISSLRQNHSRLCTTTRPQGFLSVPGRVFLSYIVAKKKHCLDPQPLSRRYDCTPYIPLTKKKRNIVARLGGKLAKGNKILK